jgi:hypothetical protein
MTTTLTRVQITERDLDVLTAIDAFPMTATQLLDYSQTFREPFTQARLAQRRLHILEQSGYVRSWPYAMASTGRSPRYFKLTRLGYRVLHGEDCVLPNRRYFEPVSDAHHYHTRCLADFLIRLTVTGHRQGISVRQFSRENSVRIEADSFTLYPDAVFQLAAPGGRAFNFVVELDNGTERVRSQQDIESISRKIKGYDAHQSEFDAFDHRRYVVLFVTTRSHIRLTHILRTAGDLMRNPQRLVFLGIDFETFLSAENPVTTPCFLDHRGKRFALVPPPERAKPQPTFVSKAAALW